MGKGIEKQALRASLLKERRAFKEQLSASDQERYAESVLGQLLSLLQSRPHAVVGSYFPMKDEFDLTLINDGLRAAGYQLCLPSVSLDYQMQFRAYHKDDVLHRNPFGFLEPGSDAIRLEPEIILVPLVAFDRKGHRVGYGQGHYDRLLHRVRFNVLAIGVAYDMQRVDEIPVDAFDQRLDYIVTEKAVYKSEEK